MEGANQQHDVPQGMISPGYRHVDARPHTTRDTYGTQSRRTWDAADTGEKNLIDAMRPEFMWRASVQGENLELVLTYGTKATIKLDNIRLPFVAFIPGQIGLTARKLDGASPASASVTLTAATGGVGVIRTFQAVAAVPGSGRLYTALTASTLTIAGVAGIAVAVGDSIPIVEPSAVTAGSGIVEHTL